MTTDYYLRVGGEIDVEGEGSPPKSKKSFTGIPSVIEKDSIDSKEGAFNPLSIRLKKSMEISKSSANRS
jgi:hypothetical protein